MCVLKIVMTHPLHTHTHTPQQRRLGSQPFFPLPSHLAFPSLPPPHVASGMITSSLPPLLDREPCRQAAAAATKSQAINSSVRGKKDEAHHTNLEAKKSNVCHDVTLLEKMVPPRELGMWGLQLCSVVKKVTSRQILLEK